MNIDYTIGDDIVALVDHPQRAFKKGDVFTCNGLYESKCKCRIPLVDIGFKTDYYLTNNCRYCKIVYKINNGIVLFKSTRFKKLDFDISELTEILEKENQKEIKI